MLDVTKMPSNILVEKIVHHHILLAVILICIEQHVYIPVEAQFFGTGSSRLEDQTQEIVKEMAQEYKEK